MANEIGGRLDIGVLRASLPKRLVLLLALLLSAFPPLSDLFRHVADALRRSTAHQAFERLHRRRPPHSVAELCSSVSAHSYVFD